mgnify:CR=1 FL=1
MTVITSKVLCRCSNCVAEQPIGSAIYFLKGGIIEDPKSRKKVKKQHAFKDTILCMKCYAAVLHHCKPLDYVEPVLYEELTRKILSDKKKKEEKK